MAPKSSLLLCYQHIAEQIPNKLLEVKQILQWHGIEIVVVEKLVPISPLLLFYCII